MIGLIFVCIIGTIAALAFAVLFLPISMSAWIEHVQDTTNYCIVISWAFSLFGVGIYSDVDGRRLQFLLGGKVLRKRKRKDRSNEKKRFVSKEKKSEGVKAQMGKEAKE